MPAQDGVIRRKLSNARAAPVEGGPGADRGWRLALSRAARDVVKQPLDVKALTSVQAGLAEVLERLPDRALLAVIEGPAEGLGVLAVSAEILHAMIEGMTIGKLTAAAPAPRKPTRTDAAMVSPLIDAALADLEQGLQEEADLIWAGGWRYGSFAEDPRPLGLMLEDIAYRVLQADVDLGLGLRQGQIIMALPALGRGAPPRRGGRPAQDDSHTHQAFVEAFGQEIDASMCQLDAVLARVLLPLSKVVGLEPGDLLPLAASGLDKISLEGLDGRKLAEGKLGQNRGMRALRLTETENMTATPVRPVEPVPAARGSDPLRRSA